MDKLEQIIFTLEKVEVHGSDNLSRMLGCIQALQQIREEVNSNGLHEQVSEQS